jgi:hypothetical protein
VWAIEVAEELSAQALTTKDQVAILSAQVGGSVEEEELDTYDRPPVSARTASCMPAIRSVKGDGKGNGATESEALIPLGENRIDELSEFMNDF